MIDVLFNESACFGLKIAQDFGEGEYQNEPVEVFFTNPDGSEPSEEEIQAAQREAEEEDRLEWERAVPIGGDPADIYGFDFQLSIGDVSENIPGAKRQQVLKWLNEFYPYPGDEPNSIAQQIQNARGDLKEVCRRISTGEEVRIWFNNKPDELCGLYWFMTQLNEIDLHDGQVSLIQLPDWDIEEDEDSIYQLDWDYIGPGAWHRFLELQKTVPTAFCRECAAHWQHLRQENAPLRVMLNGQLVSAPITIYDDFIYREIAAEDEVFAEAQLIGTIIEKYGLGIRDTLIAHRIESMISNGSLIPLTEAAPDCPVYHRQLKKTIG